MSKIKKYYSSEWDGRRVIGWEKIRKRGKLRYVAGRYVLLWGLSMATAMSAWTIYTSSSPLYPPRVFVVHFAIWPMLGFFMGIHDWRSNEKKYNEYKSEAGSA